MWQEQSKPSPNPVGWVLLLSLLTEGEIEAWREEVTCPESHSQEMAVQGEECKLGCVGSGECVQQGSCPRGDSQRALGPCREPQLSPCSASQILQNPGSSFKQSVSDCKQSPVYLHPWLTFNHIIEEVLQPQFLHCQVMSPLRWSPTAVKDSWVQRKAWLPEVT